MQILFLLAFFVASISAASSSSQGPPPSTNLLVLPAQVSARPLTNTKDLQNTIHSDEFLETCNDVRYAPTPRTAPNSPPNQKKVDYAVCFAYYCNVFALTLPVVLLPMIAAERRPGIPAASFVAAVASVATLGGAFGKVINGFVCQHVGGRKSSFVYLFGMASAAFLVSTLSDNYGLAFGAMEFCASIQWTACSVVLSNHHENDAAGFTGAISSLALASTAGIISCKAIGSALLQHMSWRRVAQVGSMVAITGSVVMHSVATEFPELTKPPPKEPFSMASIGDSFRAVLGSRLFWLAGIAHATSFLVRASDKILGSFFQEATSLPRSVCGGLTMTATLGFIHGLVSGRKFNSLETIEAKTNMWRKRYFTAFVSAIALAVSANKGFLDVLRTPFVAAVFIGLASASMASSVSFQFYQGPAFVSNEFLKNKAVCLSFMDGLGFVVTAPVFAMVSKIVSHPSLGTHGWSVAWAIFAIILGIGGTMMTSIIPPVLERQIGNIK